MYRMQRTLIVLVLAWAGGVSAQDAPDSEALAASFAFELPRGWTIDSFEIEATSDYGTPVEPDVRSRFVAVVELGEDTFFVVRQDGPYTFVRPIAEAGEQRTIYGISSSVRAAGAWRTDFMLEHDPTADTGDPRGLIPGRVIVLGSDDETAYRELLDAEAAEEHQAELTQRRRDEELRAQQREAEAAQLAHEARLQAQERQAQHEAQLAEARYDTAVHEETNKAKLAREAHEAEMLEQSHARRLREEAREAERVLELGKRLAAELEPHLRVELPGYWTIDTFTVMETASSGSYDAPSFRYRFEAAVLLARDTFVVVEADGEVTWVRPVAQADDARTLYGVATASHGGDAWAIEVALENRAGLEVGEPLTSFPGRVLALGSAEASAFHERLEAEELAAHETELRRRAREEEIRAQERQAELAQQRGEAQLHEEGRVREQAERERSRAERAAALAGLKEAYVDDDPTTHRLALAEALGGDDPHLHAQALWEVMSRRSTWAGTLHSGHADRLPENRQFAFGLVVDDIDAATGNFTGKFQGGIFAPPVLEEAARGTIRDAVVSVTTSGCALTATLEVDGASASLSGDLQCQQLNPRTWGWATNTPAAGTFQVSIPVFGAAPIVPDDSD